MPRRPDGRKTEQAAVPPAGKGRRVKLAAAILVVLLLVGSAWYGVQDSTAGASAAAPQRAANSAFLTMPEQGGAALTPSAEREVRRQKLVQQLQLADHSLCSYRNATKYPASSRPIAEHLDQAHPNQPILDTQVLHKQDGSSDSSIKIQTSQSRVYLAAGEAAAFSLRAVDNDGNTLPLVITRAVAHGLSFNGQRDAPTVSLAFTDDGQNGDVTAGDGIFSNVFAPAQTSFASFDGTIRVEVKYSVADKAGVVLFDVIYSPQVPAVWAGGVREILENGSLNFYLKANVNVPGRYIATGRIDDANGKPFALARFNDVLMQGVQEMRLQVFGKLMRDQQPAMPLKLRDVDAYLLKENADPDRALMPRLEGEVYTSKSYALQKFSEAEWQSPERSRYLTEFGKDRDQAKAVLLALDPGKTEADLPRSECVP